LVLLLLSSMRHSRADSSFLFLRLSGASGTSRIAFLEAAVFFSPITSATAFFSVFSRRQRWFFRGQLLHWITTDSFQVAKAEHSISIFSHI
jgi:hypothetical protein